MEKKIGVLGVLLAVLMVFVSGCTMKQAGDATVLGGDIIRLSQQADELQDALGEYSAHQDVLAEIDRLQTELNAGLMGTAFVDLRSVKERSTVLYPIIKGEVTARWGEISELDRAKLLALEENYLDICAAFERFEETGDGATGLSRNVLEFLSAAARIYAFYKVGI